MMNIEVERSEADRVARILAGTVTSDDREWYIGHMVEAAGVIASSQMKGSGVVDTRFFPSPIAYARARKRTELEAIPTAVLDKNVTYLAEAIANQQV